MRSTKSDIFRCWIIRFSQTLHGFLFLVGSCLDFHLQFAVFHRRLKLRRPALRSCGLFLAGHRGEILVEIDEFVRWKINVVAALQKWGELMAVCELVYGLAFVGFACLFLLDGGDFFVSGGLQLLAELFDVLVELGQVAFLAVASKVGEFLALDAGSV